MAGFSFASNAAQNTPNLHSGVSGVYENHENAVFQGGRCGLQKSENWHDKHFFGRQMATKAGQADPRSACHTASPSWLVFRSLPRALKVCLNLILASLGYAFV